MYTEEGLKESLEYYDKRIEEAKQNKKEGEALLRLVKSDDWKLAIEKGYFEREVDRLSKSIINTNNMFKRENLQNTLDMLMAIRHFKTHIEYMIHQAKVADEEIEHIQKEKEIFAMNYEAEMQAQIEREENIVDSGVVGGDE